MDDDRTEGRGEDECRDRDGERRVEPLHDGRVHRRRNSGFIIQPRGRKNKIVVLRNMIED